MPPHVGGFARAPPRGVRLILMPSVRRNRAAEHQRHRRLLAIVRDDDVCRRLMTIPGVGPVVALTYCVTVDVPARFRNSKAVGAVFGLTPSKYQSGENDRTGAISRCGDEMTRMMLYEAAQSMLARSAKWSWLKAWAMKIARHRGNRLLRRNDPAAVPPDYVAVTALTALCVGCREGVPLTTCALLTLNREPVSHVLHGPKSLGQVRRVWRCSFIPDVALAETIGSIVQPPGAS
jgi:hypothetical protein